MKKTFVAVVAVVAIVLLVAVIVGAQQRWGTTRYGGVYYSSPYRYSPYSSTFAYSPSYSYPYSSPSYNLPYSGYSTSYYSYPSYSYPSYYSPLSSRYIYRSGTPSYSYATVPSVSYPAPTTQYAASTAQRGIEGQLCGLVDNQQYGCEYGLTCDYRKATQASVGVCSSSPALPVYPPYI